MLFYLLKAQDSCLHRVECSSKVVEQVVSHFNFTFELQRQRIFTRKNRRRHEHMLEGGLDKIEHRRGSFLLTNHTVGTDALLVDARDVIAKRRIDHYNMIEDQRKCIIDSRKIGLELLEERRLHLGKNISSFYADEGGLVILYGKGSYFYDMDGNEYLDCCNNVACVGHSEPSVVKAGAEALSQIQTNSRFLHPTQQRYIRKLLSTFPPELTVIYLVNSGYVFL